jgi:hypothetical protein
MDSLAFWLPLIFLFISALIGTVLKRRAKDHCLKKFEGCVVLLPSPTGEMVEGTLHVFAQGMQLIFLEKKMQELGLIDSLVLHPSEIDKIPYLLRPTPDPDTRGGLRWKKEVYQILHPNILQRSQRTALNFYNMLKDAFGQAAKAILGALSKDTSFSQVKDSGKRVEELRSGLSDLVPNAWEPILEKYRGQKVIIERQGKKGGVFEAGLLEDYSSSYLLVREVEIKEDSLLEELSGFKLKGNRSYDVLFLRKVSIIRNTLGE